MRAPVSVLTVALLLAALLVGGCGEHRQTAGEGLHVVASLSFLADIAQNVAGDRAAVQSIVPRDTDPHSFQPAPSDLRIVSGADIVILNGSGLEGPLVTAIESVDSEAPVIEASRGLTSRRPKPGEPPLDEADSDPHFWLDPRLVVVYVQNIRDALIKADPGGAAVYNANAAAYSKQLEALDEEIRARVADLPRERRKLVMNHASHGYFADAYGFDIVGTVIPSVGTGDTPTARQLTALTQTIEETGVRAIFVELGQDTTLARQIAAETGITVVDDLLDHSLTPPDGVAPTYLDMMRFNTDRILEALRR